MDAVDANGDTPLMYSCRLNNAACAQVLLQRGANPNIKNSYEQTAVHLCCISGASATLELMIQLLCPPGSSLSTVITHIGSGDRAGITPLHAACRHGHHSCAAALLLPHLSKAGIGPNSRGPMGLTPLHLAAASAHSDLCTLLVEVKADIDALDGNGAGALFIDGSAYRALTPAGLAQAHGHFRTVSVLLQLGASDIGIDVEAVNAATTPKLRHAISPPLPNESVHKPFSTQQSRTLNPDAPSLQLPAVANFSMEQYTALMQQQWIQWGVYAQQYASMYNFPSQSINAAGYGHLWENDNFTAAPDADSRAHRST